MSANFDSATFRKVLGHLPTGVVVVTGVDALGEPAGITIGSFVSVSLDPPLVGFFPGQASRSWAHIAQGNGFCANVLTDNQSELCWRFAQEPEGGLATRFDGVKWTKSSSGMPILDGALAVIECSVESVTSAGDHHFVLGRVQQLSANAASHEAMVFYRGKVSGVSSHE